MKPQPGERITSNIELVTPIAEGAMGAVWVAYNHRLETQVAVKFVSDKLGDDTAEALARFEREAATAAQIKSPHVVQTFDSGVTANGVPFMVMELLEGESLGDRLRRSHLLGLPEAAALLAQVAKALSKAHALGIVHRDIKPDNLYLVRDPEGLFCKILDFGIAKQTRLPSMGGLTTEGKMVGTPEYLSPEQVLEGGRVDYRTDLWGLAVVLYVALTGHLPFSGTTLGQLCLALASCRHQPPSHLVPTLPRALDTWFLRALNRDPNQRFDSAKDMAMSFASLIPEDDKRAMGIDLGNNTFISVSAPVLNLSPDNTERQFGSTAASIPPPPNARRAWGPVLGAAAAIGLTALAVAGFIVMSSPTSSVAATASPTLGGAGQTAGQEAAAVAEKRAEEEEADETDEAEGGDAPTTVIDLDDQVAASAPPHKPAGKPGTPPSTPGPKPVPKDKPEEPPPPPPPVKPTGQGRDIGF